MKKIDISTKKYTNTFALVDDADFEKLNKWKWRKDNTGYVVRIDYSVIPQLKTYMHRLIMNTPRGMHTDHINYNGLDNRRENLRILSHKDNVSRSNKTTTNKLGLKWISHYNHTWTWKVQFSPRTGRIDAGCFVDIRDAIKYSNCIARVLYGEHAYQNPIT